MTEEQRLAVIAQAVANSQSITPSQSVEEFIAEIKTEDMIVEHGLFDTQRTDLEDESEFLLSDSAEEVDEEDETMGLSDEMKGVYE
tara:strand:+ start:122 stop:379 length:258 start_codon:yes stop_codon:yes gene_type:complete